MRQIDNMTQQEIDTLALKGMTAPRTASERNKACEHVTTKYADQCDKCGKYVTPAPNKAQHSPLPWKMRNATHGWIIKARNDELIVMTRGEDCVDELNAELIVRAVNHADKLAEACKSIAKLSEGWTSEQMNYAIRKAQSALDAYEAAQ